MHRKSELKSLITVGLLIVVGSTLPTESSALVLTTKDPLTAVLSLLSNCSKTGQPDLGSTGLAVDRVLDGFIRDYQDGVQCLQSRAAEMQQSKGPVDWFLGHMIDVASARDSQKRIETNTADAETGLSCLGSSTVTQRLRACTSQSQSSIIAAFQSCDATGNVLHCICSIATPLYLCVDDAVGTECSSGVKTVLRDVLQFLAGSRCIQPAVVASGSRDPRVSVIFTCGDKYFNHELNFLFPPSSLSAQRIDNLTAAAMANAESMEVFCRNATPYADCVQAGLRNPTTEIDRLAAQIMDVEAFKTTTGRLCNASDLIAEKFTCQYEVVKDSPCGAGIEDILALTSELFMNGTLASEIEQRVCRSVAHDFDCTATYVGARCGVAYYNRLNDIYKGFFKESCETMPDNSFSSDAQPCVEAVMQRYIGWMQTASDPFNKIIEIIENFCTTDAAAVMPCVMSSLKSSVQPLDLLIKKLVDVDHLSDTVKFACSKRENMKKHAMCMAQEGEKLSQGGNDSCWIQSAVKFQTIIPDMRPPIGNRTEKICSGLEDMVKCGKPVVSRCDESLANDMEELVWRLSTCRDVSSSSAGLRAIPIVTSFIGFLVSMLNYYN